MNINVDTGSIPKFAKHVTNFSCFTKSLKHLSLPFLKKEEMLSFPRVAWTPSTVAHLLDDRYKFPSQMDVLAFPEPFSIITRSFFRNATQRIMMSVSPEGNHIDLVAAIFVQKLCCMYNHFRMLPSVY